MPRITGLLVLAVGVVVSALASPISLTAQSPDSLVRLLGSPDWRVRSFALHRLPYLPDSALPSSYRSTLIALFNQEAVTPDPAAGSTGEGYGEYQIQLVDAALALHDPATLRGLAYLGVQVDEASQRFIAEQGSASLPYLDEAWTADSDAHSGIMDTWALLVGRYKDGITAQERIRILHQILQAAASEPIDFIAVAVAAPLPLVGPVLKLWTSPDTIETRRNYANQSLQKLEPLRNQLSPAQLHADLSDWLQAICLNAGAAKATACDTLTPLLAAGPSNGGALEKFQTATDFAFQDGTFTPFEHALLSANADSLLQAVLVKLPTWTPGVAYAVGDSASYNGLYYQCRQAHTAQVGWEPPKVYALWYRIAAGETWAPQVMYSLGDEVVYQSVRYRAIQAHQSQLGWEPPNVPALWTRVQ
jgi:Carbohydrate-binding module family 5/12